MGAIIALENQTYREIGLFRLIIVSNMVLYLGDYEENTIYC